MPHIKFVQTSDCGQLEGGLNKLPSLALYLAVIAVCPAPAGEALWEKIREKYQLGVSDCSKWVTNMNAAILLWNQNTPTNCEGVRGLYGV